MKKPVERRQFLKRMGAAGMALALPQLACNLRRGRGEEIPLPSLPLAPPEGAGRRPNILFLFADDHANQAISAYGSVINRTPNIDRIAREGAILRSNTCCNSICAPSRATILTGKHSHLNGIRTNGDVFDGSQTTFPKLLQEAGYETAVIGKWHLKSDPIGFDHWDILPGQGHYYNPDFIGNGVKRQVMGYNTDIITDLALHWLKAGRDPDKPFMLMCQYKAPHRNWMPGPDHLNTYDDVTIPEPDNLLDDYAGRTSSIAANTMTIARHMRPAYDLMILPESIDEIAYKGVFERMTDEQWKTFREAYESKNAVFRKANLQGDDLTRWNYQRYIKNYLRCIASVDDSVGRILEHLESAGLYENTLVIYSSDQSFYLGEHGLYDKRWMYEESLNMPFLARWPGVIPAGTEVKEMTQNIDFAPTFLAAAGLSAPEEMQGRSLLPLLRGERPADWRKSIYYHYYEGGGHGVARHEGVRTRRYKLIHFYDTDEWELFDLEKDPREMKSLHDDPAHAGVKEKMLAELARLKKLYQAPEVEPRPKKEARARG